MSKDQRIKELEDALEIAHADLQKWGYGCFGTQTRDLNRDLGKISYALNSNKYQ